MLIDDKHKSRPTFDGVDPKRFVLWCFKFNNFVCGEYPNAESVLDWAKFQHETKIITIKANTKIREVEGLTDFNNQLYTALADLLESEPLSIVKNTVGRNGLEVWRKLHHCYDPQTASRTKDSYSQIVYTNPVPLEILSHAIDVWEEHYRQHVDAGKGVINESLLCEALIKLCPEDLNENIKFQIDQLVNEDSTPSLDKIRAKIDTYIRVKIPVGGEKSGPIPMDVDSFKKDLQQKIFPLQNKNKVKGGGGKQVGKGQKGQKGQNIYMPYSYMMGGKGKGKGKYNSKGNGIPQTATQQAKGGKQAGGKGGKGSGKGNKGSTAAARSGYFKGNCGFCGKWGHRRADCRARQRAQGGINSVEFQEDWGWETSPDVDDYMEPIWDTEYLMTYPEDSWDGYEEGAQDLSQSNEPGAEPATKVIESLEEPTLDPSDEAELLSLQAQFDALGGLNSLEIPQDDFEPALTRRQKSKLRRMRYAPTWGMPVSVLETVLTWVVGRLQGTSIHLARHGHWPLGIHSWRSMATNISLQMFSIWTQIT